LIKVKLRIEDEPALESTPTIQRKNRG